jgi:hypothetical protein
MPDMVDMVDTVDTTAKTRELHPGRIRLAVSLFTRDPWGVGMMDARRRHIVLVLLCCILWASLLKFGNGINLFSVRICYLVVPEMLRCHRFVEAMQLRHALVTYATLGDQSSSSVNDITTAGVRVGESHRTIRTGSNEFAIDQIPAVDGASIEAAVSDLWV